MTTPYRKSEVPQVEVRYEWKVMDSGAAPVAAVVILVLSGLWTLGLAVMFVDWDFHAWKPMLRALVVLVVLALGWCGFFLRREPIE